MEEVAAKVIKRHHPHKEKVNIGYLFRDKAPLSGTGKITYGMAIKVDDRNHVFGGKDVIIEVSRDTWEMMDAPLKEMLIDHELHHVAFTLNEAGTGIELSQHGRPMVQVVPHDFEDFEEVLDRYPTGRKEIREIGKRYVAEIEKAKAAAKSASKAAGHKKAP